MNTANIPGYTYGDVPDAPINIQDLQLLQQTVLFTEEDRRYLQMAGEVLKDQTNDVLDLWYGYVGSHPHLLYYFTKEGVPDGEYLSRVRQRFAQWILDTCYKEYDQTWLNYQYEIGLRHHTSKKNKTDGVHAVPIINFRYIVAFIFPITFTIKGFLAKKGHNNDEVEKMYTAWFKAITLTATLWCYPYVKEGQF
jgi:hypothetical protein